MNNMEFVYNPDNYNSRLKKRNKSRNKVIYLYPKDQAKYSFQYIDMKLSEMANNCKASAFRVYNSIKNINSFLHEL